MRRWLITNLPDAQVTLVGSTAGAAQAVGNGEYDAAVCPALAGELYGLETVAARHRRQPGRGHPVRPADPPARRRPRRPATTARPWSPTSPPTTRARCSRSCSEFATRAVNLTRIESRPTKERIGQYCFSIDCEGHIADERVGEAIAALHRVCADVRYLGSYPRRDGKQGAVPAGRTDGDFRDSRTWLDGLRRTGTS